MENNNIDKQTEQKPISELMYRLIALFLLFCAFIAATVATILELPPTSFLKHKFHLYGDEGSMLIWLIFFLIFAMMDGIVLRLIKPYSNVPKHPYGDLNIKTFFSGDADQDEYKLNDK